MSVEQLKEKLLTAPSYFKAQGTGYKTWGDVQVLQIAQRVNGQEFLLTDGNKLPDQLTLADIKLLKLDEDEVYGAVLSSRKKINTILISWQQYASQLKEEVPAILDDQAQLLGVSIRVARDDWRLAETLQGRYAAVLPAGLCVCIGSNMEDAYVAAQLLEKTAKTWIEAKHLGGAKAINKIEAWLMQQYYLFKYSKEAVKNR